MESLALLFVRDEFVSEEFVSDEFVSDEARKAVKRIASGMNMVFFISRKGYRLKLYRGCADCTTRRGGLWGNWAAFAPKPDGKKPKDGLISEVKVK